MEEEQTTEITPELSWLQVEYIKHEKTPQWYMAFASVFIISALLIFLATGSIFSIVVLVLAAIASLVFANKEPQKVEYRLYSDGFSIGKREYYFDEFRSFSPIVEKGLKGVIFSPNGRLQLPMNVYFNEENADEGFSILERSLVFEQYRPDLFQRVIDFIRF